MANWKLFGFQITNEKTRKQEEQENGKNATEKSFALPQNDDGAVTLQTGAYFGTYVDLEGVVRNEIELITRYREMAMQPELETAVDDIVNEAIVMQGHTQPLTINLDNLKQPTSIKKKIREEFEIILKMLNFGNMGSELFRRWYIDGRMFYHVIIDENNPRDGIKELRYIDPRRIRKVREIQKTKDSKTAADIIKTVREYYLYNERGIIGAHSNLGMRISPDAIINVNSGLMDSRRAMVLSYLHKAIKPLNQLRMVEDATVIYRLSRAPERRVFYIDVGNLPKVKAEQYLRDLMVKYRNKLVYDSSTGEIRDDRKHLCLDMNSKVPLLDGRTLTLTEIANEYKEKQLWTYSCDPVTGKFAPGLITWAGVSRPNAEVVKITLDNGKTIICTPDHRFPILNDEMRMAKDLKSGDSLIPLYRKTKGITPGAKKNKEYEQIWENDQKKWSFTHKLVSEWKDEVKLDNEFDFNENFTTSQKATSHHKIVSVEFMTERMDTGCLTIDGNELYHNYHTFALDAGVYTQNSMLEDFWLPRREGGKGTEIQTLPGGQNLGEMEDVKYFERKLYKSLSIPISRLEMQQGFSIGRASEITRDELKFSKFVFRLRNKFSTLFDEALRVQLALKGVCTVDEWNDFKENIYYDFITDNNFDELKKAELIQNRVAVLQLADPYIGKYFSIEWARKNILNQTDEEIAEIKKQIEAEQEEMMAMAQKQAELAQAAAPQDQQTQDQQDPNNPIAPQQDGQQPQLDVNSAFQNTTSPGVSSLDDIASKQLKVENKANLNNMLRIIRDRRKVL